MSARPAWPNTWCGGGFLPRRDGGSSFVTMLMGLPRWICSRCQQSPSGCSMACLLWVMAGGNCCGSELLRIQRPNGSPNQLTEACGWEQIPRCLIRDRDGSYGEILSAAFDRSAFETARRLHVHHGKTRTQNG